MSGKNTVQVGIIQIAVSDDIEANMQKAADKVKDTAKKGAQIICLPELYRTRYFPREDKKNVKAFAETIPGKSTELFSKLAKNLKVVIILPVFEEGADNRYYNSAVVIDSDGRLMDTYRKIHIPHDPYFYEKSYFSPGDTGYRIYKTAYATFSVLICYDQWFPEAARICTLMGADIIFYPTAIGWIKKDIDYEGDWPDAWMTIQRAHAIANGVHVAAVNRVGDEGDLKFFGSSFICDSFGNILKKAGTEKEELLVAELNLDKNEAVRKGWGFLANRRPDTYRMLSDNQR